MTLARVIYVGRRLRRKYGVIGIVAGRYLEAGYSVELGHRTSKGPIDILARKEGTVLAISVVKSPARITSRLVEETAEKARLLRAKPIIVLYGRGFKITEEIRGQAEKLGVHLKRVRTA